MNTTEAFLDALVHPSVKTKYADSTIRNWRSRAKREMLSIDFMSEFLLENGYQMKQVMKWGKAETPKVAQNGSADHVTLAIHHNGEVPDEKMQLRKKLYSVRKQMDAELIARWFAWCREEYPRDYPSRKLGMSEAAFYQMTCGRHISKGNTLFAIKALREGKRLVQEYHAHIRTEIENL